MQPVIREYRPADWISLWPILKETFAAGDSYSFAPDISENSCQDLWVKTPTRTFVVLDAAGRLCGSYFIKPNQPALGAHVCNCGYVTAAFAQGRGLATAMCEHSQRVARELGFRAMQFNFVVATNERAVRLWQKLGFDIVGRLPGAFRHSQLGFVDALVMFKQLERQE